MIRKRMRALKYSKQMVDDVAQLVYLHLRFHGYGDGRWTDSAVRRYVTDAGPLLNRLTSWCAPTARPATSAGRRGAADGRKTRRQCELLDTGAQTGQKENGGAADFER